MIQHSNNTTTALRQINLQRDLLSARKARVFVRETLEEWGCPELLEAVELAVSELVTNAVVHANSPVSLTLVDHDGDVQIRVRDEASDPPVVRKISVEETGGRGMTIIEAISEHWGVEVEPPGKVIWLDISKH